MKKIKSIAQFKGFDDADNNLLVVFDGKTIKYLTSSEMHYDTRLYESLMARYGTNFRLEFIYEA